MNGLRRRGAGLLLATWAMFAAAPVLAVPVTDGCAGSSCTMAELFDGGSFTSDNLLFSGFRPALSDDLPGGGEIAANPALFLELLRPFDLGLDAVFSRGWGNASAASAGAVSVTPLGDLGATAFVDPGFRVDGGALAVNAGNTPSLQLTSFAYDVSVEDPGAGGPITSAALAQLGSSHTLGPDQSFPTDSDFAFGGAWQIVFDDEGNLLGSNLVGDFFMNILGVDVALLTSVPNIDSLGFAGEEAITVVTLLGVGATSGGSFDLGPVTQRTDPPAVPAPSTLWLATVMLAGLVRRRA